MSFRPDANTEYVLSVYPKSIQVEYPRRLHGFHWHLSTAEGVTLFDYFDAQWTDLGPRDRGRHEDWFLVPLTGFTKNEFLATFRLPHPKETI